MGKSRHAELNLLAEALVTGDLKTVRIQLQGAHTVNIRLPSRKNRPARETPLMLAAESGSLPLARLLHSLGADINATNEFRQPALLYAVRANHLSMVNLLLKWGANPNLAMADGDLVLMEAATSAIDLRICRALIKYGADINRANRMRTTALHVAASQGRADIVRLLIRAGADLNHCDRHGHGPLSCAILRNQRDVARLLLKHAEDPHRQPEALGLAAWEGNLELVKALINKGWDIHSKSHQGRTALQHARNRHHKSVIRALLDAGAT
jgi:ankyrin repeat protein